MPTKLRTPCRHVGCPALVDHPTGYCDKHRQQAHTAYRQSRPDQAEQKIYRSRRWTELSKRKRQTDPLCEQCLQQGKITPATLVHHKIPIRDGGDPWDWANLESCCASCQAISHRG